VPVVAIRCECYTYRAYYYILQRGDEVFPKDAGGEMIYEDIHYIDTWKVCSHITY